MDPDDLERVSEPFGRTPYLLYSSADGSARVNHVAVDTIANARVDLHGFGRGIAPRLDANPSTLFSLLWPAHEAGGFSLIADGTATISNDATMTMQIANAVLHRPAPVDDATEC